MKRPQKTDAKFQFSSFDHPISPVQIQQFKGHRGVRATSCYGPLSQSTAHYWSEILVMVIPLQNWNN